MQYSAARVKDMFRKPETLLGQAIEVKGWVRGNRDQKEVTFIALNDGTFYGNIQVVAHESLPNYKEITKISQGSAITVRGKFQKSELEKWARLAKAANIVPE